MLLGTVFPGREEVEVCSMLQECMDLRKKYVFPIHTGWHSDKPLTNGAPYTIAQIFKPLHFAQTFKPSPKTSDIQTDFLTPSFRARAFRRSYPRSLFLTLSLRASTNSSTQSNPLFAVVPGPEEVEVCSMLQECMELRKKYVFRARPPWHSDRKWPARDPATHKLIESPFQYTPEAGTDHVFSMKDGVMTVFPNKECEWWMFVHTGRLREMIMSFESIDRCDRFFWNGFLPPN